jgi:hypothetical protein
LIVDVNRHCALGITLYSQLYNVMDLKPSPAMLDPYALLAIAMTLGGLVTALVGAVIWTRRVSRRNALLAAASTSLLGVLLAVFVQVNIHGPTAIFMFMHNQGAFILTTPVSEHNRDISTVDLNSTHSHFGTAGDGKLIPQKFFSTASASRNSTPYV